MKAKPCPQKEIVNVNNVLKLKKSTLARAFKRGVRYIHIGPLFEVDGYSVFVLVRPVKNVRDRKYRQYVQWTEGKFGPFTWNYAWQKNRS